MSVIPRPEGIDTVLLYAVTPASVPRTEDPKTPSVVSLMIAATNAGTVPCSCAEIRFRIPVGKGRGDITNDPSSIAPAPATGTPWSIAADGGGGFAAVPQAGQGTLRPGNSIAFVLAQVEINEALGLAAIEVRELTERLRTTAVTVVKTDPGLAVTSLSAEPVQVLPGERATIRWTTTAAERCTLSSSEASIAVPTDGSATVSPERTTAYTLSASGHGLVAEETVTISVPSPQILSFAATPKQVAAGAPAMLGWRVVEAETCTIEPGQILVDPNTGAYEARPQRPTIFLLEAAGYGRSVSMPVAVDVVPAFTEIVVEVSVMLDGSASISWNSTGASGVALDGAAAGASGTQYVDLGRHTLTALGDTPNTNATVSIDIDWSGGAEPGSINTKVRLACPAGLGLPDQSASVAWDASGSVSGAIANASGFDFPVTGASGAVQVPTGERGSQPFLWTGRVFADSDAPTTIAWSFPVR